MKENFKLLIALVILALVGFVFINTSRFESTNKDVLKVGVTDSGAVEWYVDFAEKKGFFKEAGLEIEKIEVGTNTTALLSSGEVDVTSQMVAATLVPFFNDEDIKLIAVTQNNRNFYGVSRYKESDLSKTRRVGVPRIGGSFHISIIPILENLKIDLSSTEFVATGFSPKARIALLEKDEIDFTLLGSEELSSLSSSKFTFIEPTKMYKNNYAPYGVVTTKAAIESKSEELRIFVSVLMRAYDYLEQNEAELVSYFQESLDLSKSEAKDYYKAAKENRSENVVPSKEIFERLIDATIKIAEPKNPNRNIEEFIYTEIAESIIR